MPAAVAAESAAAIDIPQTAGVAQSEVENAVWLMLTGELDLVTVPQLNESVRRAEIDAELIVVDLRGLEFIDSSGAQLLLAAQRRVGRAGGRLVIVRGLHEVDWYLALVGFDREFALVDQPPVINAPVTVVKWQGGATPAIVGNSHAPVLESGHPDRRTLPGDREPSAGTAMGVTNAVVNALRVHAGKVPTRAKTFYRGDDVVVVVDGWMTPAERTLLKLRREELVVESRRSLHSLLADSIRDELRELTHRGVVATHHELHLETDHAIVVFDLEP
jgi:anti-anti-sigma factor